MEEERKAFRPDFVEFQRRLTFRRNRKGQTSKGENGQLALQNGQFMGYATDTCPGQLQPLVPPQVLHFMQVPLRTSV